MALPGTDLSLQRVSVTAVKSRGRHRTLVYTGLLALAAVGIPTFVVGPSQPYELSDTKQQLPSACRGCASANCSTDRHLFFLDATCPDKSWALLGARRPQAPSTCEPENKGRFLLHAWDAHSSAAENFAALCDAVPARSEPSAGLAREPLARWVAGPHGPGLTWVVGQQAEIGLAGGQITS